MSLKLVPPNAPSLIISTGVLFAPKSIYKTPLSSNTESVSLLTASSLPIPHKIHLKPLAKIKTSFFLLSISVDELISTPNIITFRPNPPSGNEKLPCLSNPIPYPEYLYLSISLFLVKVTADVNAFTYLINDVPVYYFFMIKCYFILFETAFIKFYSCSGTMII